MAQAVQPFADFWGYKIEAYDAIPYNTGDHDCAAGVVVSVNSDSDERARALERRKRPRRCATAISVKKRALKLITINPAIQVGYSGSSRARSK